MNKIKKKYYRKINITKTSLFEKINKIDNPLARLTKEKKDSYKQNQK